MWMSLTLGIIACLLFLYVPGFCLFRAIGFGVRYALVIAPFASVFFYCVLSVILTRAGITCSWASVALPVVLVCSAALVVRVFHERKHAKPRPSTPLSPDWVSLLLYVCAGIIVVTYVFLIPLGSPEQFMEEYDNAFHMQAVKAFSDSGRWSVLDVSKYLTDADAAMAPVPGTSFYPALWHMLCALVISLTGCSVPLAINAVIFSIICVLFPLGMLLLLSSILRKKRLVRLGAMCVLGFAPFPWFTLLWGPVYPMVFAMALAPGAASLFVLCLDTLMDHTLKKRYIFAFILSVLVLAVTQTSTVFFCVGMLTPYCAYRIWTLGHDARIWHLAIPRRLLAVLFVILVLAVWAVFVFAPFMKSTVFGFNWRALLYPDEALFVLLTFKVFWVPPQYVLGFMVIVGIVYTILRHEYLWITFSYAFFAVGFFVAITNEGVVKHFLTGFWYTDYFRILACVSIIAIPLVALGLFAVGKILRRCLKKNIARRIVSVCLLMLFCFGVYRPGIWFMGGFVDSAFGKIRWDFQDGCDHDRYILFDLDEELFVDKVLEVIPEGAVVANIADDGSAFAYASHGLRTYYRDYLGYEPEELDPAVESYELPESKLIRLSADQIASNESVREAFEKLGIEYVLVLDYGDAMEEQPLVTSYNKSVWKGLLSIRDDTPGFSIVLSEGDMRLYKIASL